MTKILIVATNYSGNFEGSKISDTGVYLEEFAVPYLVFKSCGYDITTASIQGGLCPIDINSMSCSNPMEWDDCIKILRETQKLSSVEYKNFDALYLAGGHGAMYDFPNNETLKEIVEHFYFEGKTLSAICHGVAGLVSAKNADGSSILKNKKITGFTNKEEKIAGHIEDVPFLLQDKLLELGANFIENKPWAEHAEADGNIITGQNQNSSLLIAEYIISSLEKNQ